MPLTDIAIRNAKPGAKPVKMFDEGGLFVIVAPSGGKWWRFKYRFEGKEKLLSLGTYPEVSLKDARERRDSSRKLLADGIDPSDNRKAVKVANAERAANSFEIVAREWLSKNEHTWAVNHHGRILQRLVNDIFPYLGKRPIADITPVELLKVIRKIEERGVLETAHRALANCSQVFRYGVATGRAERDPSGDLRGALASTKNKQTHFAAITDPKEVGALLRALDGYDGTAVVKAALQLAPLVFVRPDLPPTISSTEP